MKALKEKAFKSEVGAYFRIGKDLELIDGDVELIKLSDAIEVFKAEMKDVYDRRVDKADEITYNTEQRVNYLGGIGWALNELLKKLDE